MTDEEHECRILCDWLNVWGVLYTHVPNGGSRSGAREGAKLKRLGLKAGVPDYLIFDVPKRLEARGIAIEMKRRKGGATSQAQQQWIADLRDRGWLAKVCRGADDAIAWLRSLGYGRAKA